MKKASLLTMCLVAALVLAGLPGLSPVGAQTAINSSAVDTLEPYQTKKKDVIAFVQRHLTSPRKGLRTDAEKFLQRVTEPP